MKINGFQRRRFIAVFFLLALPVFVHAQFTYVTNSDGVTITITRYTGTGGAVVIPSTINGYTVTGFGSSTFYQTTNVTSVTIPNTVTSIAMNLFYLCTNLTSVTIPDSVTNIGISAFEGCNGLSSISIPGSVTIIARNAFYHCTSLTNLAIADGVTNIALDAFNGCISLTSITIPASVTSIGEQAFWSCTNLKSAWFQGNAPFDGGIIFQRDPVTVYYLAGTTGWGPTFGGAPTMEETPASDFSYQLVNGSVTITGYHGTNVMVIIPSVIGDPVTSIGANAFAIGSTGFKVISVTIPDGVTNIGNEAFSQCNVLTNITFPQSLTSIGSLAFALCSRLTGVAIPASVTAIGYGPFEGCASLNYISVDAANPSYTSPNGVLFDKAEENLIQYPGGRLGSTYTIPKSVTNIGNYAFYACSNLISIAIPASVTTIGNDAFYNCPGLADITIANGVTSIGNDAFSVCFSLTNVIIPGSVTNIGSDAFEFCSGLTSVYFPGNAPPDDGGAFASDWNATVYYLPGTTGWGATFGGVPALMWNPQATALTTTGGLLSFNITGPTNATIVVVACTNLANPVWLPVSTNTLSGSGTSSFSDPQAINYPNRFYRFSAP